MRGCDLWAELKEKARSLRDYKRRELARISLANNHQCVECLSCACQAVEEERLSDYRDKRQEQRKQGEKHV